MSDKIAARSMLLIVSEFYIFSSEAVLNEILLIISLYLAPGLPGERPGIIHVGAAILINQSIKRPNLTKVSIC